MSPSVAGLDRSLVTISSNKGTEGSLRNKMLFLAKQAGDLFISLEALEEILFQIEGEGGIEHWPRDIAREPQVLVDLQKPACLSLLWKFYLRLFVKPVSPFALGLGRLRSSSWCCWCPDSSCLLRWR